MADGTWESVEKVRAGDYVLSREEGTGRLVKGRVVEPYVRYSDGTIRLTFSSGLSVETTSEHPFFIEGRGWVEAGKLSQGVRVASRGTESDTLEKIEKRPGKRLVYNFEVEGTHSYFVGDARNPKTSDAIWVHNYTLYGARLEALAGAVQKALPSGGRGYRTAAAIVATDGTNTFNIVASSSKYLTKAQQAIAHASGAMYATGIGHAEATAIAFARGKGWQVVEVAASRPICSNCATLIERAGATAVSPLK